MKAALFAITTGALLTAPALAQDLNPSPYESRDQALEGVTEVEVRGPFRVLILAGSDESTVKLFGPPELLADARAVVEDGKLTISFKDGAGWSWNPGSGMYANIMLPRLDTIGLEGAGDVKILGLENQAIAASVGGAGTIEFNRLQAQTASFAVGGSGSIKADGVAQTVNYAVGGSGKIEAKRTRAQSALIALGGSGRVYADVSDTARVSVGGSGRVEVVGGATCVKEPAESEKIECR